MNTKVKAIEKHYLLKKHLNKIRPYLKDTINNFKKSETWKNQLTITITLLNRYQNNLENLKKGSEFVFDFVHLLYYKCHKINLSRGGSYIDSPDWIKNKKYNNKSYWSKRYAVTVVLNHEEIEKDLHRITKNKPFPNKYDLERMEKH